MNKSTIIVLAILLIISLVLMNLNKGATSYKQDEFAMPDGFSDCIVGKTSNGLSHLYMVRCPNSTTTTNHKSGKSSYRTSVTSE